VGWLSASVFSRGAALGGIAGLCLLRTSPASSSGAGWAVLGVPPSHQCSPYRAASAPVPESAWSGLDWELWPWRTAEGVSGGASHLPLSDWRESSGGL